MRLWATLDLMDGKTVVRGPLDIDEINLSGMLLHYFTRADVAGVTFTRADPLDALLRKNDELQNRSDR